VANELSTTFSYFKIYLTAANWVTQISLKSLNCSKGRANQGQNYFRYWLKALMGRPALRLVRLWSARYRKAVVIFRGLRHLLPGWTNVIQASGALTIIVSGSEKMFLTSTSIILTERSLQATLLRARLLRFSDIHIEVALAQIRRKETCWCRKRWRVIVYTNIKLRRKRWNKIRSSRNKWFQFTCQAYQVWRAEADKLPNHMKSWPVSLRVSFRRHQSCIDRDYSCFI
jgi:hypothetical protein